MASNCCSFNPKSRRSVSGLVSSPTPRRSENISASTKASGVRPSPRLRSLINMPPVRLRTRLGTVARDQRSLGASVMLFQSEVTTARPELDRERARLLFVGVEMEVSLPLAGRDKAIRDIAQRHCRAQRTVGDAVLERRGHALLGHCVGALDHGELDLVRADHADKLVYVNLAAGGGDVERRDRVRIEEGDATGDARIDSKDCRHD